MECLGPQCASMLLDWLKSRTAQSTDAAPESSGPRSQATLWRSVAYQEEIPTLRSPEELAGAFEHLEYAVFRRYQNQLTRAERARLDNTIRNALFKVERYVERLDGPERAQADRDLQAVREAVHTQRDRAERLRLQARRAELKLAQLDRLTSEGFEEFVAEIFEALGYEIEHVGGTGDEGADLRIQREGLRAVVQCKYHSKGVVGSPVLQQFLGTIHHTRSHKGFFVTTRTFSLAAEKFASDNPIELIDGPRLVELVQEAIGPGARREPEPVWF